MSGSALLGTNGKSIHTARAAKRAGGWRKGQARKCKICGRALMGADLGRCNCCGWLPGFEDAGK